MSAAGIDGDDVDDDRCDDATPSAELSSLLFEYEEGEEARETSACKTLSQASRYGMVKLSSDRMTANSPFVIGMCTNALDFLWSSCWPKSSISS